MAASVSLSGVLWLSGAKAALAHTPQEKAYYLQSRIVLQLNPADAPAGNAVGTWNLEYNQLDRSEKAFATVLANHQANFIAAAGLALIDEARGKLERSLRRIEAIANPPERFARFLALVRGRLLTRLGRFAEAERVLQGPEGDAAFSHDRHFWLGRIQEETGRPQEAAESYRRAIEADPFPMEPYSRLSLIYQRQGQARKARQVLGQVLYVDNPSPYPNNDIRVLWGWVLKPASR